MSPLTTGQFRDNLLQEREKTQSDITQMQLRITPKIWSSGVVSSTEDSATTLIIAEITGTSSVATTPVTNIGMFRLTLEKHDGTWLVSQMDPGPASSGSGSADQPTDPNAPVDPNAGATTEPAPAPAPAG
jgi:Mce-associated membrane protein